MEAPVTGYRTKISVQAAVDFCKHFVERSETLGLIIEELPKPVLEHGVPGFAVAVKPRCEHHTIQLLLCIGQSVPFNNKEHDDPHVRGPKLLEDPVTKEQKVPCIFDIQLAVSGNSKK
jgi:hypothetical protein